MGFKVNVIVVAGGVLFTTCMCAGQSRGGIKIVSVAHGTTPPLSSQAPDQSKWRPGEGPFVVPRPRRPGKGGSKNGGGGGNWTDADLQQATVPTSFTTGAVFEGQGFTGAIPPDTNLSVGVDLHGNTQIVQVVNTGYAVYDTSGNVLASGDLALSLFSQMPNANCYLNGDGGDVGVLWDQLDHRWIISQLAYSADLKQNDFCLAISDTADALGTWQVYDVSFGRYLPDYPKLAIWGDGIYFSANMFQISVNQVTGMIRSTFLGAQACSFPRPAWSTPPSTVTFTCSGSGNTGIYNLLPASLDGTTLPPGGSDYYLQFVNNQTSTSGNQLALYQFQSGQLSLLGNLSVATFHDACGGGTCVPQLGTTQQLDSLGDRLMYRLSYRNYGASQRMVVSHSVQVSSSNPQAGIRWYQLCSQAGSVPFAVCRESTFSPDATTYRWMSSMAQDKVGNIGLGYSVSSSLMFPSVAVTGLNAATDSGMEAEQVIYNGPNFQDTYSRWGDYSSMAVDPSDDCTFWYTTEYSSPLNVFGSFNFFWGTMIGNFHFPSCTAPTP